MYECTYIIDKNNDNKGKWLELLQKWRILTGRIFF
jgi:hypothetical protein